MSESSAQAPPGQQDAFRFAMFGGVPTRIPDVAASAAMIAMFAMLGLVHQRIQGLNKARNRFFIFSGITFGFCMSRIATFAFRIASAENPSSPGLHLLSQILLSSGVPLLYLINFLFARRIVAALHPTFASRKSTRYISNAYCFLLLPVLILNVIVEVESFYTTDKSRLKIYERMTASGFVYYTILLLTIMQDIRNFGATWFTVMAFIPIPGLITATMVPSQTGPKKFGSGTFLAQIGIVMSSAAILTFSVGLRTAIAFLPRSLITSAPWYDSKAAFYILLPVLEMSVVIIYAVTRVDERFYLPGKVEKAIENEKLQRIKSIEEDDDDDDYSLGP